MFVLTYLLLGIIFAIVDHLYNKHVYYEMIDQVISDKPDADKVAKVLLVPIDILLWPVWFIGWIVGFIKGAKNE